MKFSCRFPIQWWSGEKTHGKRHSLPTRAERFVRGADGQGERFSFSKHLTGDVEVGAALLVEAREAQHRVFEESFVTLLLALSL